MEEERNGENQWNEKNDSHGRNESTEWNKADDNTSRLIPKY